MKTRIVLMLFAACMLGACSSDEEQQVEVEVSQLEGRWVEVYEPHVVSEGIVYYTFHAESPTSGTCLIEVHDVFSGNHQIKQIYHLANGGRRITLLDGDGFCATGAPVYEIVRLTESRMVWKIDDRYLYFERK